MNGELFTTTRNARTGAQTEHPARWSDNAASQGAATRLRQSGALSRQRHATLMLLDMRATPTTARDLAGDSVGMYHTIARRLPELRKLGLVTAEEHPGGQRWQITDAGRAALRGAA